MRKDSRYYRIAVARMSRVVAKIATEPPRRAPQPRPAATAARESLKALDDPAVNWAVRLFGTTAAAEVRKMRERARDPRMAALLRQGGTK